MEEQNGRFAGAEALPPDADALALDEPTVVGLPGSHGGYTGSAIEAAALAAPPVSTGR